MKAAQGCEDENLGEADECGSVTDPSLEIVGTIRGLLLGSPPRLNDILEAANKQHPSRRKVTECKRSGDGLPSGQPQCRSPHSDSIEMSKWKMENK